MKVKVIYETQVGTTKKVAELIQKKLREKNHEVDLHSVLQNGLNPTIDGYNVLLFGSPTYYSGQPEINMGELITTFIPDLSNHTVAVFCLGDSNYKHFCGAAEILEDWVAQCHGKLMAPTLKIDGNKYDEDLIGNWVGQVVGQA